MILEAVHLNGHRETADDIGTLATQCWLYGGTGELLWTQGEDDVPVPYRTSQVVLNGKLARKYHSPHAVVIAAGFAFTIPDDLPF